MTEPFTVERYDQMLKDFYPRPGERIKQYVVDTWRENDWARATCPRFRIDEHKDNTGIYCWNAGEMPWTFLQHPHCATCCALHEATKDDPRVLAWIAEKAARPPIESDRSKLSDEIAPDLMLGENPLFKMLTRKATTR